MGSLRADVLARPAARGGQSGGTGGEVRRCAGLGDSAGIPLSAGRQPARHRLDRRGLRLRLGRFAARHRAALRPCRPALAERGRHANLRRGRRALPLGDGVAWWSSPPASRASVWRCSIPTYRRRSPTSRRLPGAARRSASTGSGATSAMRSAGSASGSPPNRRGARGGLLVRRGLDVPFGGLPWWWGEETHPRLNPADPVLTWTHALHRQRCALRQRTALQRPPARTGLGQVGRRQDHRLPDGRCGGRRPPRPEDAGGLLQHRAHAAPPGRLGRGQLLLCGTCMDARGLDANGLIEGAVRSTMDALAAETRGADKVLVF